MKRLAAEKHTCFIALQEFCNARPEALAESGENDIATNRPEMNWASRREAYELHVKSASEVAIHFLHLFSFLISNSFFTYGL